VDRYLHNYKKIHFVGLSAICWAVWKIRNATHFEKNSVRSPTEIICLASSFIVYWADLQKEEGVKQALEAGAEAMKEAIDNGAILLQ
jgi:hypothetical protein